MIAGRRLGRARGPGRGCGRPRDQCPVLAARARGARPSESGAGSPGTAAGTGPARPGPVELRSGRCGTLPAPGSDRTGPDIRAAPPMPPPEAGSGRDRVMKLSAARLEAARLQLTSKPLGFTCDFWMEYGELQSVVGADNACADSRG
ncbi:probable cysteine desulfurase [Onychostruthus taczanowskii]|uniref:probable cysteine desulfurase n=1 Tax=Onychostruthus taczanowskii TaxID=356909 RepID=UPI001B807F11|nr:probable cysteine desulfurase [Onychostruthus taczanowskii]